MELLNRFIRGAEMIRQFHNPLLTAAARAKFVKLDYCSYHTKNGYSVLGRPCGGDHAIIREALVYESYKDIIPLLPKRVHVVDVGAHTGTFCIWLQKQREVEEVFCFEPASDSFYLCQFNLGKAGIKNLVMMQGVSDKTEIISFWDNPKAHARNGRLKKDEGMVETKMQLVSSNEWIDRQSGNFDLLKMDCESSEWAIVDATPEVFDRFSLIVAELHTDPIKGRSHQDFARIMESRGFSTLRCDGIYIGHKQ